MSSRSGLTCVRYALCVINTVMWIVGAGILSVGLWLRISYGGYANLLHQYEIFSIDSLCIATGVITFVTAFFACCGSWLKNRCLLMTYFITLILVFVLQIIVAIIAFAFRDALTQNVSRELKLGIKFAYNDTTENGVAYAWDGMQLKFECCGVEGADDWFDASMWPQRNYVPDSCCRGAIKVPGCGMSGDRDSWFNDGCFEKAKLWFIQKLHIVGFSILLVTFIQLFGLISSMLLFCNYDHKRRSRTYKSYELDS